MTFAGLFKMPKREPVNYLKNTPVSNCCGANFCEWFPQNENPSREMQDDVKKNLDDVMARSNSMMLIILNNIQKKNWHELVKEKGFRPVMSEVFHPVHGNDLTLYAWRKYGKDVDKSKIEDYHEDFDE